LKEIRLGNGMVAIVGNKDYPKLIKKRWWFDNGKYAVRSEMIAGVREKIYMHREILKAPPGVPAYLMGRSPLCIPDGTQPSLHT
jgi:hypothetical protein